MQVTLDPIEWSRLTKFGSAEEFFSWWHESDGEDIGGASCYEIGWHSDSAIQYFHAAESLQLLLPHLDAASREHLDRGIGRLIAENGHVDELGTGDASEGCYWISASPETTREILGHVEAVDLPQLLELHRRHPPTGGANFTSDALMESSLQTMFEQHRAVLREAAARGFGLLGHCG